MEKLTKIEKIIQWLITGPVHTARAVCTDLISVPDPLGFLHLSEVFPPTLKQIISSPYYVGSPSLFLSLDMIMDLGYLSNGIYIG
jgi:hypothetical protein